MNEHIRSNPEAICPPEILELQHSVHVDYFGLDGELKTGIIEIHKDVVEDVRDFFEMATFLEFPIEQVIAASAAPYFWDDEKLMTANATSGFNYRTIAGKNEVSLHGLGRAFDVNPRLNPYIRYENGRAVARPKGAKWDPDVPGTLHAHHRLMELMKGRGWEWGGDWAPESGRVDYQHFQKP